MTNRERLLLEVQGLTDSEAAAVLEFLVERKRERQGSAWPPPFAGIGRSGCPYLDARSEEILRAEFGAS